MKKPQKMNEKRKILFSAIYIFDLGLYSILCFYYLKRYFLFLIAVSKTNITIFSLNKIITEDFESH